LFGNSPSPLGRIPGCKPGIPVIADRGEKG
jgi:hypothetical protein